MEANTDADCTLRSQLRSYLVARARAGTVSAGFDGKAVQLHWELHWKPWPAYWAVEIWLIEKGDICSRLSAKARMPRPDSLPASGRRPELSPASQRGQGITVLSQSDARMPLGVGIIGRIAATGRGRVADLDKAPPETFPAGMVAAMSKFVDSPEPPSRSKAKSWAYQLVSPVVYPTEEFRAWRQCLCRPHRRRHRQRARLRGNPAAQSATRNAERLLAGRSRGGQSLRRAGRPKRALAAHRQPD